MKNYITSIILIALLFFATNSCKKINESEEHKDESPSISKTIDYTRFMKSVKPKIRNRVKIELN